MRITKTLAAALLSICCSTACAQQGAWSGDLNVMGTKLPLVFNFSADGCTLDSPAQGAKDIPAQKSVAEDGTIKVTVAMIGATFEGKMEGDCINGTFAQGALQLPLTLKRGAQEVRRPQTPVAPFPYKQEEVSFENAGFRFGGTLCTPADCTSDTPVVLLVTGSGQQNRDEELFGHRPFAVIADALARNGIASLRYDDRGWGDESTDFSRFTTDDFKQDAAAALQLLRQRFRRVGIVGHSEGGTIALMLALSQDLSQNRPSEAREHVRRFHELFFTLSPEKSAIEHNVKRALLLADKSAYNYYQDFAEKGFYNRLIAGNINQSLQVDSVVCNFDNYPYQAKTYARQVILRESNVTERSLVTVCRLVNATRSDDNPNGLPLKVSPLWRTGTSVQ